MWPSIGNGGRACLFGIVGAGAAMSVAQQAVPSRRHIAVIVEQPHGGFARGLGSGDFEVQSEGVPVTVESCVPASDPATVLVLIDASRSASNRWGVIGSFPTFDEREGETEDAIAGEFLKRLAPTDRVRAASFGRRLLLGPPFAFDHSVFALGLPGLLRLNSDETLGPTPTWA